MNLLCPASSPQRFVYGIHARCVSSGCNLFVIAVVAFHCMGVTPFIPCLADEHLGCYRYEECCYEHLYIRFGLIIFNSLRYILCLNPCFELFMVYI